MNDEDFDLTFGVEDSELFRADALAVIYNLSK